MDQGLTSVDRYDRQNLAPYQETLVDWAAGSARVLEFGPSTGYMSEAMRAIGCHVTAVEIDRDALPHLQMRADEAHWGDLDQLGSLSFLDGRLFDTIVLADVLEHLRLPGQALRDARARLTANGCALVSMPNIAYWRIRTDLLRGRWRMTKTGILDETHLRFFTRETAEEMFVQAGFSVERWESVWWEFPFDNKVRVHAPRMSSVKTMLNDVAKRRYPELFSSQYLWVLRRALDVP